MSEEPRWSRVVGLTIAVAVGYMALRHYLYAHLPPSLARDDWMCVPRAAALAAYLAIMRSHEPWRSWGWHWGWSGAGAAILLAALGEGLLAYTLPPGERLSTARAVAGWLSTALVAIHEEAAFRGLLFNALDRWTRRPRLAALLAAAVFTVWHYEAQPLASWPDIFLFGFCACAALKLGVGLPWLALGHWAADVAWYQRNSGEGDVNFATWLIGLALLAVGAFWSWQALPRATATGKDRAD